MLIFQQNFDDALANASTILWIFSAECTISVRSVPLAVNRVLKEHPSPISDEEQRLNQRQGCTLSQLRSGHCHLLQDYTHRMFGEPSDICTECGASPQDVRQLFACNAHPTELSPVDPWRNPVDQFVRLATSPTETLTDLTTDLVVANKNKRSSLTSIFVVFLFALKCATIKRSAFWRVGCRLRPPCL